MKSIKGFTLIELLVVITILGILAAVVMVAINPGERINEANDSGKKNDVGQVATALESYFTANTGSYTGASSAELVARGYIKRFPTTTTLTVAADGSAAAAYGTLAAASASCPVGQSGTKYWCYTSATGQSGILCSAATPSTACN